METEDEVAQKQAFEKILDKYQTQDPILGSRKIKKKLQHSSVPPEKGKKKNYLIQDKPRKQRTPSPRRQRPQQLTTL
jgi:hypothetical protein